MGIQTTETGYVKFKDGAKVEVKKAGGSYVDIGALGGDIALSVEYTENVIESANAGRLLKQIKSMTVAGSFPLININPTNIEAMGGGLFTQTNTAGSEILAAAFTDQTITTFVANTKIPLVAIETATGLPIKFSAAPTITSVTASSSGALAANNDYTIVVDAQAASGYSIVFNTSGTATVATSETIVIDWGNNTPVARTTLTAGSSTKVLTAYSIKFTHTDSASKIRSLELFSVNTNSGGFVFNFGGANSDGVEEMPVAFTASLDTSLTDGAQLLAYIEDVGAA